MRVSGSMIRWRVRASSSAPMGPFTLVPFVRIRSRVWGKSNGETNSEFLIVVAWNLNTKAADIVATKVNIRMVSSMVQMPVSTSIVLFYSTSACVWLGEGTYTCIDGREYVGKWLHGQRMGMGTMILCPVSERGDHNNRFIGGLNALYRPLKYSGSWVNGKRVGHGKLEMMDGMTLEGSFDDGLLEGYADVSFSDGGKRIALFEFGKRVGWTDDQKGAPGKCWADVGIDRKIHRAIGKDLTWLNPHAKARRDQLESATSGVYKPHPCGSPTSRYKLPDKHGKSEWKGTSMSAGTSGRERNN